MATRDEILEAIRAFLAQHRVGETETPARDHEAPRCVECGEVAPCEFERSRE